MSKSSVSQEARVELLKQVKERYLNKWVEYTWIGGVGVMFNNTTCGFCENIELIPSKYGPSFRFIMDNSVVKDQNGAIIERRLSKVWANFDKFKLNSLTLIEPEEVALIVLSQ